MYAHLHEQASTDQNDGPTLPHGRPALHGEDVPQALGSRQMQDNAAGCVQGVDDDVNDVPAEAPGRLESNVAKKN